MAEQARKLDRACARIVACRVVAEALHRQEQQATQFSVQLSITLPGMEVVVNREHGEDIHVAVRDAFDAAGLQIKDRLRGQGSSARRAGDGTPDPDR